MTRREVWCSLECCKIPGGRPVSAKSREEQQTNAGEISESALFLLFLLNLVPGFEATVSSKAEAEAKAALATV